MQPKDSFKFEISGSDYAGAFLDIALNYKPKPSLHTRWIKSLSGKRENVLTQSRFYHNRWASLPILSFIDNAVVDGIIGIVKNCPGDCVDI